MQFACVLSKIKDIPSLKNKTVLSSPQVVPSIYDEKVTSVFPCDVASASASVNVSFVSPTPTNFQQSGSPSVSLKSVVFATLTTFIRFLNKEYNV